MAAEPPLKLRGALPFLALGAVVVVAACSAIPREIPSTRRLSIPLRWIPGHPGETWAEARMGLLWSLSNLGALPPRDLSRAFLDERGEAEGRRFRLDLAEAGFPRESFPALERAIEPLLVSDEMSLTGAIDVGRFLMATLYEPARYYDITGACPTFRDWQVSRRGEERGLATYGVVVSQITKSERFIRFRPKPPDLHAMAFEVAEGEGSLEAATFRPREHETVDVMPNGQLRFAVYGDDGRLRASGSPRVSPAGQPGKCMWCHEMRVQLGTLRNRAVPPHLAPVEFQRDLLAIQDAIDAARRSLPTSLDFDTYHVHTWGERLAEDFLSPSPDRLAREWGVRKAEVESLAKERAMPTHIHTEYRDLGPLYTRADADAVFGAILPDLAARPGHPFFGRNVERWTPIGVRPSAREALESDGAIEDRAGARPGCQAADRP